MIRRRLFQKFMVIVGVLMVASVIVVMTIYTVKKGREKLAIVPHMEKIDRTLPSFKTLEPLIGGEVHTILLRNKVYLIHFFGSWCPTCVAELKELKKIEDSGIEIYGIDFAERPKFDIKRWLKENNLSNIFNYVLYDVDEKLGIELGVTGAPETFVVDGFGRIRMHIVGMITTKVWKEKLLPFINLIRE